MSEKRVMDLDERTHVRVIWADRSEVVTMAEWTTDPRFGASNYRHELLTEAEAEADLAKRRAVQS